MDLVKRRVDVAFRAMA